MKKLKFDIKDQTKQQKQQQESCQQISKQDLSSNLSLSQIQQKALPLKELFRFADKLDFVLILIGVLGSLFAGAGIPVFFVLFGNILQPFFTYQNGIVDTEKGKQTFIQFIYIGLTVLFGSLVMFFCWNYSGYRQSNKCKQKFYQSLLYQNQAFLQEKNCINLISQFDSDIQIFQIVLSSKFVIVILVITTTLIRIGITLYQGWELSLVIIAALPFIFIAGFFFIQASKRKIIYQNQDAEKILPQIQEILDSIETAKMLNKQIFQTNKFKKVLNSHQNQDLKYGFLQGLALGAMFMIIILAYALGIWYGSTLIENKVYNHIGINYQYTGGIVIAIVASIIMGFYFTTQVAPNLQKITQAKFAIKRIYQVIDSIQKRQQNHQSEKDGIIFHESFEGVIRFNQVYFSYPTAKEVLVLKNMNLEFKFDKVALLGHSGCGKSTIFQLMLRIYDPDSGSITVDGVNLKQLNLKWWRSQIGYISQHSVLFSRSIKENILFGQTQKQINSSQVQNLLDNALKASQSFRFVDALQKKADTVIGKDGYFSGGQKQRISIARAFAKNPKILLMDEATSALDKLNQSKILQNIQKYFPKTKIITIAHRLDTISNSKYIYLFKNGQVEKQGTKSQMNETLNIVCQQDSQKLSSINLQKKKSSFQKSQKQIFKIQKNNTILKDQTYQIQQSENQQQSQQQQEVSNSQQFGSQYKGKVFFRIFGYASNKKNAFILSIVLSVSSGLIIPAFGLFFGKLTYNLVFFNADPIFSRSSINTYCCVFLSLSIFSLLNKSFQYLTYALVGSQITKNMRVQIFQKLLKMPIYWHDQMKRKSIFLQSLVSSDCRHINSLISTFIGILIEILTGFCSSIIIGLIFQWRVALIVLATIPFIFLTGVLKMRFMQGSFEKTEDQAKIKIFMRQTIFNRLTVSVENAQQKLAEQYKKQLEASQKSSLWHGVVIGFTYGLSHFITFFGMGLVFYLALIILQDNIDTVKPQNQIAAIFVIWLTASISGNNFQFIPDIGRAKKSAKKIFYVLDQKDQDQLQIQEGSQLKKDGIIGNIQLKDISFQYKSRNLTVLKHINLKIKENQKIGITGYSGCGKSTIFKLLMRFYEPTNGQIKIQGINIRQYNIHYLRQIFGIVNQEPILFQGTLLENVKFNEDKTTQQIYEALKQANCSQFILSKSLMAYQNPLTKKSNLINLNLQIKYKGSNLSGGQKQRIAIARALIKKPKILLLDEATSALDKNNEQILSKNILKFMKKGTIINITHRYDQLKQYDKIIFMQKGQIVERGSFQQLINLKGKLYQLTLNLNYDISKSIKINRNKSFESNKEIK